MPERPNAGSEAAIEGRVYRPVWFAYLDILGDPVRATSLPYNITMTGTGDPDLDGFQFQSLNARVAAVGEVKNQEGGSEPLSITLSGLILPDADLLAIIADRANWQGRLVRLWQGNLDEAGAFTGNIWNYHVGWMSSLKIGGTPDAQLLHLQTESYLAMFADARKRTYQDQNLVDPNDDSIKLATAVSSRTGGGRFAGGGGALVRNGGGGRMVEW